MQLGKHPEIELKHPPLGEPFLTDGRELKWRIVACLWNRLPDLQGIRVTVVGGTAALRGILRSQHDKYVCLECCRHVPGVLRVVDELSVAE